MKFVGVTGGIGSGKSTVRAALARRGAITIDVDEVSRGLQEPGQPFFEQIVERWGATVVGADGRLDRDALAALVFAQPDQLRELTALAAPLTETEVVRRAARHVDDPHAVVVLESALFLRPMYGMTAVVLVDTPIELAVDRLVATRGMSDADARARVDAQLAPTERRAHADHVVHNDGSPEDLEAQIDALLAWIRTQPDAVPTTDRNNPS